MIHFFSKALCLFLTLIASANISVLLMTVFSGEIFGQSALNVRELTSLLLKNDPGLKNYWLPEELSRSQRLGIRYHSVENKFMIGYTIEERVAGLILNQRSKYEWNQSALHDGYCILTLRATAEPYKKEFHIKGGHLVSPVFYHSRGWKKAESDFFVFYISEPKRFNDYCIRQLDSFVVQTCTLLNMSDTLITRLRTNKIYYFLCNDEEEIERLSGFRTRGIYLLAFDYVVTTYNCHFHELAHLLINYKLSSLPLYTNPFFQEGFAVAAGGRGGLSPGVLFDCGHFLASSGFAGIHEIILPDGFFQADASISYPLSGLYNQFLIGEWGIEKYLNLYREQSYDHGMDSFRQTDSALYPSGFMWRHYLQNVAADPVIRIEKAPANAGRIMNESHLEIWEENNRYYFKMMDTVFITASEHFAGYSSNVFYSLFPSGRYRSEKYMIAVNLGEISIYNFFTNIRIADYILSMKTTPAELKGNDGYYYFSVKKELFDEPLSGCLFKTI